MYLYLVIPNEKTLNLPSAREALESRLKMLKLSESQEEASEKQEVRDKALDTFMRFVFHISQAPSPPHPLIIYVPPLTYNG